MVGNSLTFAFGPKLLDDEETPDKHHADKQWKQQDRADGEEDRIEENARPIGRTADEEEEHDNETTSLLPDAVARRVDVLRSDVMEESGKRWIQLPASIRRALTLFGSFLNAPLIGVIIGVILGLTPPLHRAFFNEPDEGGFFKAWLTASVKNVGDLFAALQLVVVGAKLSNSLVRMKKGEASGTVPCIPMLTIFFIRFILWPAISISVIWVIAAKTKWLDEDPVLWFVLMLMPTGPPATKLIALADVSGADEDEKMSISKFITISYAVSPVICLAVVGALKASVALTS